MIDTTKWPILSGIDGTVTTPGGDDLDDVSVGRHPSGHYPGRAPFEAYGKGGFRFAGMSHRGSLIALPSGIGAWSVTQPDDLSVASLARVFAEPRGGDFQFLLLGTGKTQVYPPVEIVRACLDAGIGLDVMSTGAACRTYNVLLSEGRPVGAAVIAVDA